jgi:hypothetical protein
LSRVLIFLGIAILLAMLLPGCELFCLRPSVATFRLVDRDGMPALPRWVAFRDGDGPWIRLPTADPGLTWSHQVTDPAGRYAFAVVDPSGRPVQIFAGTLSEIQTFTSMTFSLPEEASTLTVKGHLDNLLSGSGWSVGIAGDIDRPYDGPREDYEIGVRIPSVYDILAVRTDVAGTPDRLWLRRDVLMTGDLDAPIDFLDPALSSAGIAKSMSVIGGTLDQGMVSIDTGRAFNRTSWMTEPAAASQSAKASALPAQLRYLDLPEAWRRPGDRIRVSGLSGGLTLMLCDSVDKTPVLDFSDLTEFDSTSFAGRSLSWKPHPGAKIYSFTPPKISGSTRYVVQVTPGYVGDACTFVVPDLSGVDGWDPVWNFNPGTGIAEGAAGGCDSSLETMLLESCMNRYGTGRRVWWVSTPDYWN